MIRVKKTGLQDNLEAGYAPVYSHIIGVQAMPYGVISIWG